MTAYSRILLQAKTFFNTALALVALWTGGNAFAYDVTPGMTGAWYDPNRSGEGYILQVLSDSKAVVFWFTFDTDGQQFWLLGSGDVEGSRITFNDMNEYSGGKFGPEFDREDVTRSRWGTLSLDFSDCGKGTATYSGPQAYGTGSFNIVRLSSIWGFNCQGQQQPLDKSGDGLLRPGFSGAWYDYEHTGEGFTVEVLKQDQALVYWFTYDTEGHPAWFASIAKIVGTTIFADKILRPVGAKFGKDFDPADVDRQLWGEGVFTFGSCTSGGMRYLGPEGWGPESSQLLNRLTVIGGADCNIDGGLARLTARMSVAENSYIDGDTNDPQTPFVTNNSKVPGDWQDLFSPAQLAGFVTAVKTEGEDGRFKDEPDQVDLYRIDLRKGDSVTLSIANPDPSDKGGDLDLYLYDTDDVTAPVDTSLGTGNTEQVFAPIDGTYFVTVGAQEGGSNYSLRTGWDVADTSVKLTVNTASAPDQLLVVFDDPSGLQANTAVSGAKASGKDLESKYRLNRIAGQHGDTVLYELQSSYIDMEIQTPFPYEQYGFGIGDHRAWVAVVTAKRLQRERGVKDASPNYLLQNQAVPNDLYYPNQWHYNMVDLEGAWDLTTGSKEIVVAVIDTGVAPHPDLVANVVYSLGYDFVENSYFSPSYDGNGLDPDAVDPGVGYAPGGYTSHGTHVAGTIGAQTNNGLGVGGVNWDVTIMPIRAGRGPSGLFDCNSILNGLKWAGRISNSSGRLPAKQADVINMSFGGSPGCAGAEDVLTQLRNKGIILIAAAGNEETSQRKYPASYPGVVSVSATNRGDGLAWYSNYGTSVDVAAPGGDSRFGEQGGVMSTTYSTLPYSSRYFPDLVGIDGTSMASPHVAGIAALMKSVYPDMTAGDFDDALMSGEITDDLAANGQTNKDNSFGYGRINARKAVNWALAETGGPQRETFITSSAGSLDFGSTDIGKLVVVGKSGPENIEFSMWYWEHPYFSLTAVNTNSNALGTYRLELNRNGLSRGRYRSKVWFEADNDSIVDVPISFQVGDSIAGEAGNQYALLIDLYTLTPMKWWSGNGSSSSYPVKFDQVASGYYLLLVGSDMDLDGYICDEGEYCQVYPSNEQPELIVLEGSDISLSNFYLTFPDSIGENSTNSAALAGNSAQPGNPHSELLEGMKIQQQSGGWKSFIGRPGD